MIANEDGSGELQATINVTPLVDVMLVLLVILMVVTPMLKRDLPVDLPIAEHGREAVPTPNQVVVTLTAEDRLLVDGVEVTPDGLSTALAGLEVVFLEADRTLAYGRVVEVMDACRAAGVERIGIMTRTDRGNAGSDPISRVRATQTEVPL
jgi:biopolymer transport protein ExbD